MPNEKPFWDMTIQAPLVEQAVTYASKGNALDLGSGEGRNAFYLAEQGFNVIAVDNDPSAVESIKQQNMKAPHRVEVTQSDILAFEITKKFDFIVCNMVLHFLKSEAEVQSMITKMQAITNPGGLNVIAVYTTKNEPGKRPYLFKENQLKDLYGTWEIISYEEKPTLWFQMPDESEPRRNQAAYLIARKPSNET